MRYQLMCKDDVRAEFDINRVADECRVSNIDIKGILPIGCDTNTLNSWVNKRNASKHREHLQAFLHSINCNDTIGFLELTHGISINDCYWVRKYGEDVSWSAVSPYDNEYDELRQRLSFDGNGLHGIQMSSTSPEFGTSGDFDKC